MNKIKRKYIVDEKNRKIAVQIDIKTFNKIEEIMENYSLYKLMVENQSDEVFDRKKAKQYYARLRKAN